MILSFHPCFEADQNIICAGRPPGPKDLAAIQAAQAVILPQGCSAQLYHLARNNCPNVFPNWDARFDYPGKCGQIRLFEKCRAPHPETHVFESLSEFLRIVQKGNLPPPLPYILKLDWGGEGEGVFFIDSNKTMQAALEKVAAFEASGQRGFIIQDFIPCDCRSLRVVVIGERFISYWRVQKDKKVLFTHLSKGAVIDHEGDPELQVAGQTAAKELCNNTGINLAGFDILFPHKKTDRSHQPFFLEINYFFGRSGLGGSEAFYTVLTEEIHKWTEKLR